MCLVTMPPSDDAVGDDASEDIFALRYVKYAQLLV